MREEPPYAWHVRVPDMPAYTGAVKIDFYGDGLRLQFAEGKLVVAEPCQGPANGNDASAGFPPLVFLQLLFEYHSLDELRTFFLDAWAGPEAALLLDALSPKQASAVHPLCTL